MSSINNIVDITITTESGAVAVQGFGLPTFIADSALASDAAAFERFKTYADLTEVAGDYADTTMAYKFAQKIFSAEAPPSEIAIANTATDDASFTASLTAVQIESTGLFCFAIESRTLQDAIDSAVWTEANSLNFIYCEDTVVDIGESGTDGLGTYVDTNGLKQTAVFYHEDAETYPVEGAFIGAWITLEIGSWTAKFKDAIGIPASRLTSAQEAASRVINVNTFVDKGSFRMIQEGTAGAKFLDEVYADAWIKARLSEAMLSTFKKLDLVPYDDDGIGIIENDVLRKVFDEGIDRGIITDHVFDEDGKRTGGYEITSPKASSIPSTEKEIRVYSRTTFKYFKRVAMHKAVMTGVALY